MRFVRAIAAADLWPGEMTGVVVGGQRVLLVSLETGVCAYEDRCKHQGVPLSEGTLAGTVLTCRAHQWQYDVRTGAGVNPAGVQLRCYPVRVEGGAIWVGLEP